MTTVDLLIVHGCLTSPPASAHPLAGEAMERVWSLPDGAIAVARGKIVEVGATSSLTRRMRARRVLHAGGRLITPGLVDAHTHLIFAGDRAREFELRMKGASYQEIARAGGGILSTVRASRRTPSGRLAAMTRDRLDRALAHGTTTIEIKSGYGLSVGEELRVLKVIQHLRRTHPLEIVPTLLGAHALPRAFRRKRQAFVDLVSERMVPAVARSGLAEFFDVFCDEAAFTVRETRTMFRAAQRAGFKLKLHAHEFSANGGARLAAVAGAVSADHLLRLRHRDMVGLRDAGTVAVLLPGTPFGLGLGVYAPARAMIRLGLPVALGTDCNPGTSYCESMRAMLTLACTQMRMSPAEALSAGTLNAAWAIGRGRSVGALAAGRQADLVIWNVQDYRHLAYHYGVSLTHMVFKRGKMVWRQGIRTGGGSVR